MTHLNRFWSTGFVLAIAILLSSTPSSSKNINYGNDSSEWANDGECDDPRFSGPGTASTLLDEDLGRDATDCRNLLQQGKVQFGNQTTQPSTSTNSVTDDLSGVPDEQKYSLNLVANNNAIRLNRTNLPFFAGLSSVLVNKCELPNNARDRGDLLAFSLSAASNMAFGSDYSNPDLSVSLGSQMENSALFIAGAEIAEQMPCNSTLAKNTAEGILKSLNASEQRGSDGRSQFIRTCSPAFDETRCNCLAQQGRSVIPDIHSRSYNRGIIAEILQRNPMVGLQIAFVCGISNY